MEDIYKIEEMLEAEEPNYKLILDTAEKLEHNWFQARDTHETEVEQNVFTLDNLDKLYSIWYCAGFSAFELCQDNLEYMERAEYFLNNLPNRWNFYKHITLAKIYLYNSKLEDALSHLEIYGQLLDDPRVTEDLESEVVQFHRETLNVGLAATYFAKNDLVKYYEYYELYINTITQSAGIPIDRGLLLMNFLPYLELNADNLTFLERLLPICPFMEDTIGIRYDLWINSEISNETGNYSEALDLAIQFKASHSAYFEMSEDSFDEGWRVLSLRDPEGEEKDWPSDNFIHPALGTYDHIPIGKLVDNRINTLSMRLEIDRQTK